MSSTLTKKDDQILYIGINQNRSLISVGTERGFRVFCAQTLKEVGGREMGGGIGIVEILHSSNIIAMTGGGRYPLYSLKKLIIWDDDECKRKAELVMKSEIKAVKIKLD